MHSKSGKLSILINKNKNTSVFDHFDIINEAAQGNDQLAEGDQDTLGKFIIDGDSLLGQGRFGKVYLA